MAVLLGKVQSQIDGGRDADQVVEYAPDTPISYQEHVLLRQKLASSWIVLFMICESILEFTPLSFCFIRAVKVHASEAWVIDETTSVRYRPMRILTGSFVVVRHFR